ncbi:hypothetical protein HMN09_00090300 [Mycena chlorophos]|uniref:Ribosomal protein S15 n=1 Tax=Mycena chlorophos TaxID=658473 RepID=A0A8H6WMW7_MYCCL|nr:hypothetical protein HMN09_00090300 [Mycena chlorophos]
MLRAVIPSKSPAFSSPSSSFHSSAVVSKISEARLRSRALKKANLEKRAVRDQVRQANAPSVILGTRPGDEDKWNKCLLARVIVDETVFSKDFKTDPLVEKYKGVDVPLYRAFGVHEAEEQLIFDELDGTTRLLLPNRRHDTTTVTNFARAIDLRNADAGGIAYENRLRIIKAFSTPENPFDPGRSEVQAALITYRIRKLYAHLMRCRKDVQNKLSLRKLVHQRAKVLKYLKRTQRPRWELLLKDLGLEPEAVEGELIVN